MVIQNRIFKGFTESICDEKFGGSSLANLDNINQVISITEKLKQSSWWSYLWVELPDNYVFLQMVPTRESQRQIIEDVMKRRQ